MKDVEKFFSEMTARKFLRIALMSIAAILLFQLGVLAGSRHFRHAFIAYPGGGYGLPFMGMYDGMPHAMMVEGHGTVGSVSVVALPNITVTERDGEVRQIIVASTTQIRELKLDSSGAGSETQVTPASIHAGQFIVAVGIPDESDNLNATLIRIMLPSSNATATPQY